MSCPMKPPHSCVMVDGQGTCPDMAGQRGRMTTWGMVCPAAHAAWVEAGRPEAPQRPARITEGSVPAPAAPARVLPPVFREAPDSLEAWTLGYWQEYAGELIEAQDAQAQVRGLAREITTDWGALFRRPNVVLLGDTGTGKTLLLRILGRLAAQAGLSVRFVQFHDLLDDIKSTRSPLSGRTEESVVHGYVAPDLLILDEVKPGHGDAGKNEDIAHDIIKRRHGKDLGESQRPTWVTSNLSLRELVTVLGKPAVDRLLDGGAVPWFCTWPSYRRKQV